MYEPVTIALATTVAAIGGLLGGGRDAQPPQEPAQPVAASPSSSTKGTVVMVHGGGWRGFDERGQQALMRRPGQLFLDRGWRIVSVDYRAGQDGLQDVVDVVARELALPTGGLLCLYGESAGAHLALLAASRLGGVDCVMAAGPPTDLLAYLAEAGASGDANRTVIANLMRQWFGSTPESLAPWEPVRKARTLPADVLLLRQTGDLAIPRDQIDRYVAKRPTARHAELESAGEVSADTWWLHGTLSAEGRRRFRGELGGFADRSVAAHRAERRAKRRCSATQRTITGSRADRSRLAARLRCLARNDSKVTRGHAVRARTMSVRLRGRVNAARAWAALRRKLSGRRALAALAAKRATVTLRRGAPSRLTVRVRR